MKPFSGYLEKCCRAPLTSLCIPCLDLVFCALRARVFWCRCRMHLQVASLTIPSFRDSYVMWFCEKEAFPFLPCCMKCTQAVKRIVLWRTGGTVATKFAAFKRLFQIQVLRCHNGFVAATSIKLFPSILKCTCDILL
uniref:Uncharacterized protein n=1 Tax=Rhipicephalus zambeziensis TaxID=60191 RepID=A0A224YHI2_9ACAR